MYVSKITYALVLRRTNYGEADRVVTLLTKDYGKLPVIAKGVRKQKSRLAGGIEPFSVSEVSITAGRGKMAVLSGARLHTYHGSFINDLNKVEFAYSALRQIDKLLEEQTNEESRYYHLVLALFTALNSQARLPIIKLWWLVQLSEISGHKIRQSTTLSNIPFSEDEAYAFDAENGGFLVSESGDIKSYHIKFIRVAQSNAPDVLCKIIQADECTEILYPYIKAFAKLHI